MLDRLGGLKLFSKIDLNSGYNHICIHSSNEWKTIFKTHKSLYKRLVMYLDYLNTEYLYKVDEPSITAFYRKIFCCLL